MTAISWALAAACCGALVWGGCALSVRGCWRLSFLLLVAVLVRLALAATTRGFPPDIGTFSAWAAHAADGLGSFYSPGYFADYPPGYIYVLWVIGKVRLLAGLGFGTPAFLVLLKLPAILADAATVWLLYRLAGRRWGRGGALALAALYAFDPAVLLDSAVWGQVDGVLTLFVLVGIGLLSVRPAGSGASFAAALLVKPQALIFAPLPLFWFARRLLPPRDRRACADLLAFTGAGVLVFSLGVLPFAVHEDVGWIVGKYVGTLASYPYATINAFNLFALLGANLAPSTQRFLSLPYSVWGTLFIVLIVLFTAGVMFRARGSSGLWYAPLFLSASAFVLSAKMHERYLFPAVALALGFFIVSRGRRALWLFAGFSVTEFLNAGEVLALSWQGVYAVPRFDPLLLGVSLANLCLWLLLVSVGYGPYLSGQGPFEPALQEDAAWAVDA